MKCLKILMIIASITGGSCDQYNSNKDDPTYKFYVCMGPHSKRYHKDSKCDGLDKCTTEIEEVKKYYAIRDLERTPCGICCQSCNK